MVAWTRHNSSNHICSLRAVPSIAHAATQLLTTVTIMLFIIVSMHTTGSGGRSGYWGNGHSSSNINSSTNKQGGLPTWAMAVIILMRLFVTLPTVTALWVGLHLRVKRAALWMPGRAVQIPVPMPTTFGQRPHYYLYIKGTVLITSHVMIASGGTWHRSIAWEPEPVLLGVWLAYRQPFQRIHSTVHALLATFAALCCTALAALMITTPTMAGYTVAAVWTAGVTLCRTLTQALALYLQWREQTSQLNASGTSTPCFVTHTAVLLLSRLVNAMVLAHPGSWSA